MSSYPWHWTSNPAVARRLTAAYGSPDEAGRAYEKAQAAGAPSLLAGAVTEASADELMAALRVLDLARWETVYQRMHWIFEFEYEGGPESADRLDPADRAALIPPSKDPEVNRYADAVMAAVHEDMAAGLVPCDVGSFTALHDHRDANMYLIRLVPFVAYGCGCTPEPPPADEPGDQPYLHSDLCAVRGDGGAEDRYVALGNAVSDEVSRRLAAEAAEFRRLTGWAHDDCPGQFAFHERLPAATIYACGTCGQHRVAQDNPARHATAMAGLAEALTDAAGELDAALAERVCRDCGNNPCVYPCAPEAGPLAHDLASGGSPWQGASLEPEARPEVPR